VAAVTGGSRGIGLGIATALAREGFDLAVCGQRAEADVAPTLDALRAEGARVVYARADISDAEHRATFLAAIRASYDALHVLVNNAGIAIADDPERCTLELYRRHNAIMNEGVFLGCQAALPLMKAAGSGSIINMSSIASHLGYPVFFAYSAAKGAVRSLSKALAVYCQTQGYNIRVNTIHPGAIDTPMIDQTAAQLGVKNKADMTPVVGMGRPEDVANAVVFLASDESRFINGTEIIIDNALSIR
jgi:3(or 17)beta-hydroxysteroid dehydrogenase